MSRPLLDTDVVIDYLRRREPALALVRRMSARPIISAVTLAELFAGVREGEERTTLDSLMIAFRVIPVTREIAARGGLYRRQFRKSHGVQLSDALIAATAEVMGAEFFTINVRHYPMFPSLPAAYAR